MKSPYPAYRAGGVPWLTDVPQHWGVERIKEVSYLKGRVGWKGLTSDEFLESGFACLVTGTDFRAKHIDWSECHWVDQDRYEDDPFIQLKEGDLLITKDGTIGKLAIVTGLKNPACLNSGIFLVRPITSYKTTYLYWVLSSSTFSHFCDLASYGSTIQHLYQNVFENFAFPIPPEAEQDAIVAFLDREIAKIDALVEEQRRLIELLKEKRKAIIAHAVTKGLDPNAKMKPSGVEWLGQVPDHWDVVPCGYRYDVQLGRMLNEERAQGDDLRPYLRVLDVQWHHINVDDLPVMNFPPEARQRYRLQPGDLLVNEGGSYVGRSAIWRGDLAECYYQKALHRLRPRDRSRDTTEFLLFVMEMGTKLGAFIAGGNQTTIDHLTAEQLRAQRFPFPPVNEQAAIAQLLAEANGRLDELERGAKAAIDLLTERRAALISAAVTGKIDVREAMVAETAAA
jgi:type I restriction enzyme S subunit